MLSMGRTVAMGGVCAIYCFVFGITMLPAHALVQGAQPRRNVWGPRIFVTGFAHKQHEPRAPVEDAPSKIQQVDPNSPAFTALLNEAGYLRIAKLESTPDMAAFMKRVISSLNLEVSGEAGFTGTVPFYSGERTMQSLFAMRQELITVSAEEAGWLKEKTSGYASFVQTAITGDTAPLSERGYQALLKKRDHDSMAVFVRRTVEDLGYKVLDQGKLHGIVPYYSGEIDNQTFAKLRGEIISNVRRPDAWATNADTAPLGEEGYRQIAALSSEDEMRNFVKRLAEHVGCSINEDAALFKKISLNDGTDGTQSFKWLESQVRRDCRVSDEIHYGSMHDVVGHDGILQVRLENSTRFMYSAKQLQRAGIVPTQFSATNAKLASQDQLRQSCPLRTDPDAKDICKKQEQKLRVWGLGEGQPGCVSKVEQAITDSHRRALLTAQQREEEWTAIIEDDVVPLHPGYFDDAFQRIWRKRPSWAKMVRLSWCTFESDLGSIRKKTYAQSSQFRLVQHMTWYDNSAGMHRYYTGGCTTGYMVHKSFIPELLNMFPCCCPIDCCMERQLFYAPTKPVAIEGKFRGEQVMINMDAWDSKTDSFNYTNFNQGGVFAQDNRQLKSERPDWGASDSN